MQGLRDYLKFIKRGFGRTSHLTSIDIRNGRMTREEAVKLVKAYDGKKPKALDFFLKMTQITEDEFYDYAFNHIVEPNKEVSRDFLKKNISNKVPDDFQEIEKNL
jgi:hypothetical protein